MVSVIILIITEDLILLSWCIHNFLAPQFQHCHFCCWILSALVALCPSHLKKILNLKHF